MKFTSRVFAPLVCAAASGLVFLSGCGSGGTVSTPPIPPTTTSVLISGKVLAGSQPIVGASVQVYSAGASGNGSGATPLLLLPVTTDASGAFAITSGLSCSSAAPMVYLIARGGKVGSAAANSSIALATAVGNCNQLSTTATTSFTVNEVTTVSFAWALSQFLNPGGSIGATSTNAVGLANAFATAANLADPVQGKSPGSSFPATGRSPASKINALANLLNTCVSSANANSCSALFSATAPANAAAPSDTLDAALRLARSPGQNVAALYTQSISSTAYSPVIPKAPSDWTISISYGGAGMNMPTGIGVDSKGNVWVASLNGAASKFTPTGSPVFSSGITGNGLQTSFGLAVDAQDNVWIPNEASPSTVNGGKGSVTVLSSSGQAVSGATGYISGGLSYPIAVAIDPSGSAWVLNYFNSTVTLLSSSGAPLSGKGGYSAPSLAFVVSVVADANHNAWIGNQNNEYVTQLSGDGSKSSGVACCSGPQGLAIDQRGYIWAANFYGDSVSQISPSGSIMSPQSGYSGGGIFHPQGIAVDGAGAIWVMNLRNAPGSVNPTLAQMAGSNASAPGSILSSATGWLADANLVQPYALAIDASGNLWITNFTNDATYANSNSIVEVVGMAVPVKTPVIGPPQVP
ncbi:NHL repeat-containing protein [Edaphobacter flagellatus]|uniref:NHL repeat-containing protein n=1 Tax=Edaphobacter flagellatus TaxID=1933044 RepID=UPI0021B206C6|nr:NHL repeat-containing protein [Edaphobacter flagellatus]